MPAGIKDQNFTTKELKRDPDWLRLTVDNAILELVRPKYDILKAYNYYHGVRDPELYRYLEENFGLGNATSIEFTPILKKHVDAIVGEYLDTPIIPKVSCKDSKTIDNIYRDKQLKIIEELLNLLNLKLRNSILNAINGKPEDPLTAEDAAKVKEDVTETFVSEYETAALNMVEFIIQDADLDFANKLKVLLTDLLISGSAFYRVKPSSSGEMIDIEVLNPLATFTDYNPESFYRKNDYRSVVVKFMTRAQILEKYGKDLTDEQIGKLEHDLDLYFNDTYSYYVRNDSTNPTGYPTAMPGILAFKDVSPSFPRGELGYYFYQLNRLLPVHEVEWLITSKVGKKYRMDRYEAVRIGTDIYILTGESKNVVRSMDYPDRCTLSVNGVYYQDRNTNPYSMIISCMHLQDRYDITNFFKSTVIASSGTKGDWVDIPTLPTFLSPNVKERLMKWMAYKKGGVALLDSSREGRAFNDNTTHGGFDDTLTADVIQAFLLELLSIEEIVSSITGVFRERLNGISAKDAVTNVAVGLKNSFTLTKLYYLIMDKLCLGILIDSLNIAKIVFKKGIRGTLILGDKSRKVFTALPEHYSFTDFDVHIPSTTDAIRQLEQIKAAALLLIGAGKVGPEILVEVITARSISELKSNVNRAIAKAKQEADTINKLQLQLQEALKQSQQLKQLLDLVTQEKEKLNAKKLELDEKKIMLEDKREWFLIKEKAAVDRQQVELKRMLIELESMETRDNERLNDEVKNVV